MSINIASAIAAESCPPDSKTLKVTETKKLTILICKCDGFQVYNGNACVAPEEFSLPSGVPIIITGEAFTAGPSLRAYGIKNNWSSGIVGKWIASTLEAANGNYDRAKSLLKEVTQKFQNDKIIKTYRGALDNYEKIQFTARGPFGPFAADKLDPDRLKSLKRKAVRSIIEASILRGRGNYEEAVKRYKDALASASVARDHELRREIIDASVWTRQLKASRDEMLNPDNQEAYYKKRRNERSAHRAYTLGAHLSDSGNNQKALSFFKESLQYYAQTEDKTMPFILKRHISKLESHQTRNQESKNGKRPLTIYTRSSRTNLMLDALEYGKGDWNKSITYLETASAADPKNLNIIKALEYVRGLSAR